MFSVCFDEQFAERSVVYVQVRWRCNVGEGTLGVAELVENHVVGLITCEGGVDVLGVVTLLRGVAQVVLRGDQVVELSVLHEGEVKEDGERRSKLKREEGEVKERRSCVMMGWSETQKHLESWGACDTDIKKCIETARSTCRAHCLCNLRVWVFVNFVVDVVCVMLVLIVRVDIRAVYLQFLLSFSVVGDVLFTLLSFVILYWKDLIIDVAKDHFEVHVDEGEFRSSESNFERWRHVIVSMQNVVILECWSRSPRWLHDWTRCPCSMT